MQQVDLLDVEPYRKYEALADKVRHLSDLGMTQGEIASALGTTPRAVRRAVRLEARSPEATGPWDPRSTKCFPTRSPTSTLTSLRDAQRERQC